MRLHRLFKSLSECHSNLLYPSVLSSKLSKDIPFGFTSFLPFKCAECADGEVHVDHGPVILCSVFCRSWFHGTIYSAYYSRVSLGYE